MSTLKEAGQRTGPTRDMQFDLDSVADHWFNRAVPLFLLLFVLLVTTADPADCDQTRATRDVGNLSRQVDDRGRLLDDGVTTPLQLVLFEQRLTAEQRYSPLSVNLNDAIRRIEGIHDPTRVGLFGRVLHMEVRTGIASTRNVFGERWFVADRDPNLHFRSDYLGKVWLFGPAASCDNLKRYRPHEILVVFDQLSDDDCRKLKATRFEDTNFYSEISDTALSLPLFASPSAGERFTLDELRAEQQARASAVRERLHLRWFMRKNN